ncbi:hypothetical protein HPB49_012228 [Dermacentor silvarum]|uniref:Uncharacterized protein n=1 Tax=Dermacentor silvarum TaxID=543639 RepID=A0ACB8D5E7_DERSI|nr:hypothetical protein HPB49_012228 [Dermacentor silvarum]
MISVQFTRVIRFPALQSKSAQKDPGYSLRVVVAGQQIPEKTTIRILGMWIQSNRHVNHTLTILRTTTLQVARMISRVATRHHGMREEDTLKLIRNLVSYTTVRRVKGSEKPSHGFGRDDRLACRCRGAVAKASRGRGGTVAAAGTVAGTRLCYRVRRLAMLRTTLRCPAATHEERDPGSAHADSTSVGLDQEQPSATAPWQEPLSRPRP